jgi:hypothetical protein
MTNGGRALSNVLRSNGKSFSTTWCVVPASIVAAASIALITANKKASALAEEKPKERLDIYLMDGIAGRGYLNHHPETMALMFQAKKYRVRSDADNIINDVPDEDEDDNPRPRGVPSRLRLLTVDVPEFKRDAFERPGICRLPHEIFDSADGTKRLVEFVDGVAPPKSTERAGKRASKKPIIQKSLARELYYCYDPHYKRQMSKLTEKGMMDVNSKYMGEPKIGVEILGRIYTSTSKRWKNVGDTSKVEIIDEAIADADEVQVVDERMTSASIPPKFRSDFEDEDIDDPDYERSHPNNQYAWLEEMHLRINGLVPFGSPMQRASAFSQSMYGRIYCQSIPASNRNGWLSLGGWLSWLWWPWGGGRAIGSWDGVDGEGESKLYGSNDGNTHYWKATPKIKPNRASNKPHAVICDGSAMQRVPGSLRYLTKICREAGIPLYVLNDPRTWGSQTHSTLSDALVDLKRAVSDNIIRNAFDLREGTAFERGRLVGQLEKELAWQAYDASRKTRESLMEVRRKLMSSKIPDWSGLNEDDILKRLIERKVITVESESKSLKFSDGFVEVCRKCIASNKKNPTSSSDKST